MKFGKYLEGRQLELPEYSGHFIDYKGLKKLIKQLAIPVLPVIGTPTVLSGTVTGPVTPVEEHDDAVRRLQENKASFFFRLERELEKVNSFYLEKEADMNVKFNILQSKYNNYKSSGRLNSREAISFKAIYGGFIKFQKDLSNFEQYVELNKTGFSKVLKKWDKRSHSQEKEFYLATVVSVQPIFARNEALRLNDETLNILIELNDVNNNNTQLVDSRPEARDVAQSRAAGVSVTTELQPTSHTASYNDAAQFAQSASIVKVKPATATSSSDSLASSPQLFDSDTQIENWYIELLNVAKLKDDERRRVALASFATGKIEHFINNNIVNPSVNKDVILRECLSRLFLLLISSTIDDSNLQTFYESTRANIDLLYFGEDEEVFSKRNILHKTMHCPTQPRTFIVQVCIDSLPLDTLRELINGQDIYLRTPLHYAAELGKLSAVNLILETGLVRTIDTIDNNSKTPLILSIIHNNIAITESLLIIGGASVVSKMDDKSGPQFSPLCVACKYSNFEATALILRLRDARGIKLNDTSDPEAIDSLHIIAKNGGDERIIKLLIQHGADPNGLDTFNKWTPLFYAIQEGNAKAVKLLLDNGANLNITDEDNKSPLFYTLWDSHIGVLNALLPYLSSERKTHGIPQPLITPVQNDDMLDDIDDLTDALDDKIPDFELPPPIIPLRKYGHNFLEKKIFIKLSFKNGVNNIHFNQDNDLELIKPGRMTITSNLSDIVPRNIIFPVGQATEYDEANSGRCEVTFLIDTLENFSIDIEIFASFGTRLLAKASAMSHFFTKELVSSLRNVTLSLFDHRLNCVGGLELEYQVILPYPGKPLQITKYEPYWKSTGNNKKSPSIMGLLPGTSVGNSNDGLVESTIVTSSSLTGTYISMKVFALNDGTVVASPNFYVDVGGTTILISDLSKTQLEQLCGYKIDEILDTIDGDDPMDISDASENERVLLFFKKLIMSKVFKFETLLKAIPKSIQLIVQVCFPTTVEIAEVPVKISPFVTINEFIDNILYIIFEHERTLRHSGQSIRSIVFSSCNWQVCSILNWKQPNFPVLLRMNTLTTSNGVFVSDTPHRLKSLSIHKESMSIPVWTEQSESVNGLNVQDQAASVAPAHPSATAPEPPVEDKGPIRIHDMVKFAISNNLLGVIIPYELLNLCDMLNSAIKSQELLLIGSSHDSSDVMADDKEINGRYYDSELIFN